MVLPSLPLFIPNCVSGTPRNIFLHSGKTNRHIPAAFRLWPHSSAMDVGHFLDVHDVHKKIEDPGLGPRYLEPLRQEGHFRRSFSEINYLPRTKPARKHFVQLVKKPVMAH